MKGLYLSYNDWKGNIFFTKRIVDGISEHTTRMDKVEIDEEVVSYIKDNNIDYLLMPLPRKSTQGIDIPIISILGDPPRKISMGSELGEICRDKNIIGLVTHDYCTIEPIKEIVKPYVPDIKVFYFKYGLDFNYMKDYKLNKEIDVSNMGKLSAYKYRRDLHSLLSIYKNINYRFLRELPTGNLEEHYTRYGKNINKSWISIGGCQQEPNLCYYKNKLISTSFQKNLEICACRSSLLTSEWGDREYLGFEDDVNCIIFRSIRNALQKIDYYLNHKEELQTITDNGFQHVHNNHDINKTIPELIHQIERDI